MADRGRRAVAKRRFKTLLLFKTCRKLRYNASLTMKSTWPDAVCLLGHVTGYVLLTTRTGQSTVLLLHVQKTTRP